MYNKDNNTDTLPLRKQLLYTDVTDSPPCILVDFGYTVRSFQWKSITILIFTLDYAYFVIHLYFVPVLFQSTDRLTDCQSEKPCHHSAVPPKYRLIGIVYINSPPEELIYRSHEWQSEVPDASSPKVIKFLGDVMVLGRVTIATGIVAIRAMRFTVRETF